MKKKTTRELASQTIPTGDDSKLLRLPASRAHVWAHCGASETIRKAADPFTSSDDARRGVIVHKLAALQLTQPEGKRPDSDFDIIEKQIYEREKDEIDEAVRFYAGVVLDALEAARERDSRAELFVEQTIRTTTPRYLIEGPPDAYILEPREPRVTVFDLKSGWVEVEAENNAQLLVYAHAVARFHNLKAPALRGVIVQPPLKQVAYADFSFDADFFDRLDVRPDRFNVGAHCAACSSKAGCHALAKRIAALEALTIEQIKARPDLLDIAKPAEKFFADIQSQAFAYLKAGGKIDGWAIGKHTGRRTWDKETTADKLAKRFNLRRDTFVEEKLAGVKEVETALKKAKVKNAAELSSFYYQPSTPKLKRVKEDENFLTAAATPEPAKPARRAPGAASKARPAAGGKKKVKTK